MNRFIKKILRILCFIFFLYLNLSLIFQIYNGRVNFSNIYNEPIKENNEVNDLNKSMLFNEVNKWILNNRLYQYSSSLLVKKSSLHQIDSIILVTKDFEDHEIKQTFRCVLKWPENGDEIELRIDNVYNLMSNLRRVQCGVNQEMKNLSGILVAIISIYDFKKYDELTKQEMESKFYKLPRNMLNLQIPRIIEIRENKLEEVAHCVDYTHNINDDDDVKRILDWIEIQRQIGVNKIILYNSNLHTLLEDGVYKKYNQTFVEIRPYKINYESICDIHRLDILKKDSITKYQVLNDLCEFAFYYFFDNPSLDAKNRLRHQTVTLNDCYSSLQHIYKYVSHYNFDEIIYPRTSYSLNSEELICDVSSFCKHKKDYEIKMSLYDYLNYILIRSRTISSSISFFYFQNAFYLEFNYYSKLLMSDLNEIISDKNQLKDLHSNKMLHFNFKNRHGHYFFINSSDHTHIKNIYELFKRIECINDGIIKKLDSKIDPNYIRFLYLVTDDEFQKGRSIYNTDNVYGIFAHNTHLVKPDTQKVLVDINDGVLSHFKVDLYKSATDFKSSIQNLKIDFEYYMHLVTQLSDTCVFNK